MLRDRRVVPRTTVATVTIPRKSLEALQARTKMLQTTLDSLRRHLKSAQLPTCVSMKRATGPILDIVITGEDAFVIGKETLDIEQLRRKVAGELADARACGCVHTVTVRYREYLTSYAYSMALERLEESFYVKRLGPVE